MYTYVSPVYFLLQQIKSKPSIFSLNHSGEITLLPNETSVSAAAIHSLTERINNVISKCSLLSLDRRGEKTLPQRKQSLNCCTCWRSSVQFSVQFPDEWITVQCHNSLRTGHSGYLDSSSSTSLPAPAEAC